MTRLDTGAVKDVLRAAADALDASPSELASWLRTVDDADDEERAVNARLSALDWLSDFIAADLRDSGHCDHAVGICLCGVRRVLDNVLAARKALADKE